MYLSSNLKHFKEIRGISYRKISEGSKIGLYSLTNLKNGAEENVTILTVMKLASYFNVSIDDLVYKDLSK